MNLKEKKLLIEEYCQIKSEMKTLEERKKEIEESLKDELKVGSKYETENFILNVTERVNKTLDPKLIYDMVKKKEIFLDVVTVSMTKVKKYLAPIQIDKAVTGETISIIFNVKQK